MSDFEKLGAPEPTGISRRTVMKGAAWAVPVIAIASSASAATASQTPLPQPGDNCKDASYAKNSFRFYVQQPTVVGDTITLSGNAMLSETSLAGTCGITVKLTNSTGSGASLVLTYEVTAVASTTTRPYIIIQGTNTSGGTRQVDVSQKRGTTHWDWSFLSNTDNCESLKWPATCATLTPVAP